MCAHRHGASAPQVKASIEKKVAAAKLDRSLAEYWQENSGLSPLESYQRAMDIINGNLAALPQMVQEAPAETSKGELLEWANGIAVAAAQAAERGIKAGIAEKALQLEEAKLRMCLALVWSVLRDPEVGASKEQLAASARTIRREFPSQLAGG